MIAIMVCMCSIIFHFIWNHLAAKMVDVMYEEYIRHCTQIDNEAAAEYYRKLISTDSENPIEEATS